MPDWINQSDLLEYFFYFKNKSAHSFPIQARKIIQIADFFENEYLIEDIIKYELEPNLNLENALSLLEDSFQKLTSGDDIGKYWFDFFLIVMDYVAQNLFYYVENELSKIKHMNKKLLEELIER